MEKHTFKKLKTHKPKHQKTLKSSIFEYKTNFEKVKSVNRELRKKQNTAKLTVKLHKTLHNLEANYFSKIPTIMVQFHQGSRQYFDEVIKLENMYFLRGEKLSLSNGFYNLKELTILTETQQKEIKY